MITVTDRKPGYRLPAARVWTGKCFHCKSKVAAHDKDVVASSFLRPTTLKGGCPVCGAEDVIMFLDNAPDSAFAWVVGCLGFLLLVTFFLNWCGVL
jgi:hypothetical protein